MNSPVDQIAVAGGHRHHHTAVHTHRATLATACVSGATRARRRRGTTRTSAARHGTAVAERITTPSKLTRQPELAPTPAWAASPAHGGRLSCSTDHLVALGEPERRRPPPTRPPPHPKRAMRAARLVQIHQRLLQAMPRCLSEPRVFILCVGPTDALLVITNPRTTPTICAALLQTGVPHRPTSGRDLFGILGLLSREFDPKAATCQHNSARHLYLDCRHQPAEFNLRIHLDHRTHMTRHGVELHQPSFPAITLLRRLHTHRSHGVATSKRHSEIPALQRGSRVLPAT